MCMYCDGYSREEVHAEYDRLVSEFGWMVHHIGGGSLARPCWSFTMGLSLGLDHPELVVVGAHAQVAQNVAERPRPAGP